LYKEFGRHAYGTPQRPGAQADKMPALRRAVRERKRAEVLGTHGAAPVHPDQRVGLSKSTCRPRE
jgi:hypothetical protein